MPQDSLPVRLLVALLDAEDHAPQFHFVVRVLSPWNHLNQIPAWHVIVHLYLISLSLDSGPQSCLGTVDIVIVIYYKAVEFLFLGPLHVRVHFDLLEGLSGKAADGACLLLNGRRDQLK